MRYAFLVLITAIIIANVSGNIGRIIGGSNAVRAYPYMVSAWTPKINSSNSYSFCGGAILNQYWVLTAAHCGSVRFVRMGNNDLSKQTIIHFIFTSITFDYNKETIENDIQLLRLVKKITFIPGRVEPISIYNGTIPKDAQLSLSGWGWLKESLMPMYLQVLNYTYLTQSMCMFYNKMTPKKSGNFYSDISNMCALSDVRTGVCYGDSGGPLIYNGQIVGVTSRFMGLTCSCGYPDIFAYIPYFTSQIAIVIAN